MAGQAGQMETVNSVSSRSPSTQSDDVQSDSTAQSGNPTITVSVTAPADKEAHPKREYNVVKRLESGGRILSLIRKAETKKVAKRKIITFLKKKGVSESKIIEAYSKHYAQEGLYEITFNERPLGFSVIMDTRGKNAIVSSIQDDANGQLGMKLASRIYEINGKRVDDQKHKDILKLMAQQPTPFYVVFKESTKKSSRLERHKKKMDAALQWQTEEEEVDVFAADDNDSDTEESYSSDDDEAHVAHHYQKKKQLKKKKKKGNSSTSSSLFKPHEIDRWDASHIANEQEAMLKHLSQLMIGAVSAVDQEKNADGGSGHQATVTALTDSGIDGMSHKRANTMRALLDVTVPKGHESKETASRKLSVGDLQNLDSVDDEYDPEIFRYLNELVGSNAENKHIPLTPSTSKMMRDLFHDTSADIDDDDEEEYRRTFKFENSHSGGATATGGGGGVVVGGGGTRQRHSPQYSNSISSVSELPKSLDDDKDDEDVIESLEQGTTLLKYGKYGKPKYKMFHLTPDHKYLVWFSQKKSAEQTRIRIKEIRKIAIGSESKVAERTKKQELRETSFTIFYGKAGAEKMWKSLTVTAKNEKEAFVWAQGLKILSDASKQGKHLRTLSKNSISGAGPPADDASTDSAGGGHHKKEQSVIISIDQMQRQSMFDIFGKSSAASTTSLLKQHSKHKQQLQKCVDFVMTKANYKAIAAAGEFEKVKGTLEDLDYRLRDIKQRLSVPDEFDALKSKVKADLFSCAADLDALKQKLTAIVRRPQKL